MRLAVVVVAYNHAPEVLTCLNSLQALAANPQSIAWHVQDDCSPEVMFPAVIPRCVASVERNPQNVGFAANANAGARFVINNYGAEVVFLLNQDIQAVPQYSQGWDAALLKAFEGDEVGVVGARLLFPNGSIQNAGGAFDALAQPVHRYLGYSNPNAAICATAGAVEWTTGAAMAIQSNLFQYLGGFDEQYQRGYFEDVSFCIRAREAKARIWYEPACTLVHSVGSTGGSPYFAQNARRFKREFVDTGRVKSGTLQPQFRYW